MRFLLTVILTIAFMAVKGQSYSYTYIEPCTGKYKTITIPYGQNNITVNYYGNVSSFNANDFNSGVFSSWMSSIAQVNSGKPCGEITTVLTNNVNMAITQNVISTVVNVTAISSMVQGMSALSTGLGNRVTNSENGGSGTSNGNVKNGKNKSNGNGASSKSGANGNQGSGQTGTQGGPSKGQTSGNGTAGSTTQRQTTGSGNTDQGGASTNQSQGQGTGTNNGGSTGTGSTGTGNSTAGSTGNPGSSNSGQNGSNQGGGSGSSGGTAQSNQEKPNGQQNTVTTQDEDKSKSSGGGASSGISNSISNAEDNSSGGNGNGKGSSRSKTGSLIGNGDVVVLKSAEDPSAKNQLRFTMSITRANTNSTRVFGVLGNFTTQVKNSNLTLYRAWVLPKSSITMIGANSSMVNFDRDFFNTSTVLASKRFKGGNWKKLTIMSGVNYTIGNLGETKFTNLSAVGGGFYSFKINSKVSGSILCLTVYSPFTRFYDGRWWDSNFLVVPFSSWDYSITKKFKFNMSLSGVYQVGKNMLNYQVLTGGKLML